MKITCPHCKRAMSFEDEKLRDYLGGDDSQVDEGNQPARQTWIMVILVATALACTVGFGGGALFTRPTRQRTNNEIAVIKDTAQQQVEATNQQLRQAESKASQLKLAVEDLRVVVGDLRSEIATLKKENRELRDARADSEKRLTVLLETPFAAPKATTPSGPDKFETKTVLSPLEFDVVSTHHYIDMLGVKVKITNISNRHVGGYCYVTCILHDAQGETLTFKGHYPVKSDDGLSPGASTHKDWIINVQPDLVKSISFQIEDIDW